MNENVSFLWKLLSLLTFSTIIISRLWLWCSKIFWLYLPCLSVSSIIAKAIRQFHWHSELGLGLPMGRINLWWFIWLWIWIPDHFSKFHKHCTIWHFMEDISISYTHSHRPHFMKLSKMTDANKRMNPVHFASDAADTRSRGCWSMRKPRFKSWIMSTWR